MKKNILKGLGVLVIFIMFSLNTAFAETTSERIYAGPDGYTIRVHLDEHYYYNPNVHVWVTGYIDMYYRCAVYGDYSTAYLAAQDMSHKQVITTY